ncbi:MAG: polysaccharide deacetylase family protein [Clostridia bacterium]|nr:polysaccharide deacetylase family protein [Clostridia bacterium]
MKPIRTITVLLLLFCLTSCADSIDLICSEAGEIAAFFERDRVFSREPSLYVSAAEPDPPSRPILETETHTEIIESPYNSASSAATVASVGKSGESLRAVTRSLTDGEKTKYTGVPYFADCDIAAVTEVLGTYGIAAEVVLRSNPAPAGQVFAIEYAGVTDGSRYYINRDVPVTLYVSNQKPAKTAADGDNLVYLTFDDGPTLSDTGELLDVLDTYGVKAAFFVTGEAVAKYPESAREIVGRGHLLGCHSVTHKYEKIYENAAALEAEMIEWEAIVADAGITLRQKLFRFPGGSVSGYLTDYKRLTMTAMLTERGYTIYDWNVVTNDSLLSLRPDGVTTYDYIRDTFAETLAQCVRENEGKSGAPVIILMHETVPETVDLMPWLLGYLIGEGYTFGSLDQMGGSWTFADRE